MLNRWPRPGLVRLFQRNDKKKRQSCSTRPHRAETGQSSGEGAPDSASHRKRVCAMSSSVEARIQVAASVLRGPRWLRWKARRAGRSLATRAAHPCAYHPRPILPSNRCAAFCSSFPGSQCRLVTAPSYHASAWCSLCRAGLLQGRGTLFPSDDASNPRLQDGVTVPKTASSTGLYV